MSDDLNIRGTLSETTVAELFRSLMRSSETAILSLETSGRDDVIYFSGGRIVQATSSDPDLGLAEILLCGGQLDLDAYLDATSRMHGRKRAGAVLCDLGHLRTDELLPSIEKQAAMIVREVLSFRDGTYTIEISEALPKEIVSLRIDTERLVLDGIGRIERWSPIRRGLGSPTRLLGHAAAAASRVYHLDLTSEEGEIYALLEEPQSVLSVCARSYLSHFETCRIVLGLLTIDLLSDADSTGVSPARMEMENEFEIEELVERYNSAYQKMFEAVMNEAGDSVYDFSERVVVHLSPELLPYLSGMSMVNEGRLDIDQLLDNLTASGTADRLGVTGGLLNELFYGWLYEIKAEFGTRLDHKLTPVIQSVRREA